MAGRNSLLTAERVQIIVEALEGGNYDIVAYSRAGISESTFYSWLEQGANPELTTTGKVKAKSKAFVEFLEAVTRARVEGEAYHVKNWKDKGQADWKASMEFLARRYPERWARQERLDVTSNKETVEGVTFLIKTGDEDAGTTDD